MTSLSPKSSCVLFMVVFLMGEDVHGCIIKEHSLLL